MKGGVQTTPNIDFKCTKLVKIQSLLRHQNKILFSASTQDLLVHKRL